MQRLFDPPISTSNLYSPDVDRLCQTFRRAVDDQGRLVSGALVKDLELRLCQYHESQHCIVFATGFWALVAVVKLKCLTDKPQVIIPSFTYRRLADVIFWANKTPVMVDVDVETLAIDCNAVRSAISDQTALILAVHPIVNCCDVTQLISLANETQLPIAFDAVESVHETIQGQRIGSFGVGEVFSFHASKLINGIEGGYVCTNDTVLRDELVQFRSGQFNADDQRLWGINAIMPDGHAAYALAGLEEIDANVAHNQAIYASYQSALSDVPGIRLLTFNDKEQTSFKNIVAEITDAFPLSRDELVEHLNQQGVLARAHYSPALHTKCYRYPTESSQLPVTEKVMTRLINLPCGQRVSTGQVRTTCLFLNSLARSRDDS
ncbi:MAG: DegT/DnrJ/EryC1/StrS family aminotransferase [Pirellulaceae bacterium]